MRSRFSAFRQSRHLYCNGNGAIQLVNTGPAGASILTNVDRFELIEAETIHREQGMETGPSSEGTPDVL